MSDESGKLISNLIRPEIQALKSYHVPPSTGLLKLDAMENPNPWPGTLQQEWLAALANAEVNRYPDPAASGVREGLRQLLDLDSLQSSSGKELEILLGNGSDEIIQMIAMSVAGSDKTIMAPEPSFVMYNMIATFVGMKYVGVELNSDFSIDVEAFVSAIREHNPAVIFLAVPNNPTGNIFDLSAVKQIIETSQGLVVLDEAYMAFTDSDLLGLLSDYSNVVVMRTLSKVGLAGLRLGFMIGEKSWINEFDKVRLPYNINVLTQVSAEFALRHYDDLSAQSRGLRQAREVLFAQLNDIDGIEAFPSHANFILVRLNRGDARSAFEAMKQSGVLIKCLDGAHPLLSNCLRLTVGLPDQNDEMISALKGALA